MSPNQLRYHYLPAPMHMAIVHDQSRRHRIYNYMYKQAIRLEKEISQLQVGTKQSRSQTLEVATSSKCAYP